MKKIKLTKGKITIVDNNDYDYLLSIGVWYASKSACNYYAKRDMVMDGRRVRLYMHRTILEAKLGYEIPLGMEVDHINRNTLDNRRENLRLVTKSENSKNRRRWLKR